MLTKTTFIRTILDSVLEANKQQAEMSGGGWLTDAGVEYIIQYLCGKNLFREINKNGGGYVYFECLIKDVLYESNARKKRGPLPDELKGSKRIDIVLANKNGNPIIPIEIKKSANNKNFIVDAKRILHLLSRSDRIFDGTLKYGAICAFVHGSGKTADGAEQSLRRKISTCESNIRNEFDEISIEFHSKSKAPEYFDEYGYWAAGAVCVYLRRKRESG